MNHTEHCADCLTLAPMRGLTGHIYRDLFAKQFGGFDQAMAPFISTVRADRINASLVKDIRPEVNQRLSVIPQLIGRDPDDFFVLAEHIAAMGYEEVNWNLGCPAPMVVKRKRGSGLLAYPDMIAAVLDRVADHMPCRLSLKVRLGVDRNDQLLGLIPLINRTPLSEVIIHPRTARQLYKGSPDLDMFERCLARIEHPVVYNGDINSVADFKRLSTRFRGIRRWMIGRGVLVNPFLALAIRGEDVQGSDPAERIHGFVDELYARYCDELFGPRPILGKMKELWTYQSCFFVEGPQLLKRIQRSQTLGDYDRIVEAFFNRKPTVA